MRDGKWRVPEIQRLLAAVLDDWQSLEQRPALWRDMAGTLQCNLRVLAARVEDARQSLEKCPTFPKLQKS